MPQIELLSRLEQQLQALVPNDGSGILVALSGGPDSVATLLAVHHWGHKNQRPVAAAHLNHQLRGEEADADTVFCGNLCQQLDVLFFTETADLRAAARTRGLGLEEAGRHLRRQFCEGLLVAHPQYQAIATGHHLDDQVETVVMRLFRGAGTEGMQGILPRAGHWLHPLLETERGEILAFLTAVDQPWRTDASNLAGDNLRARLRREFLPLAREIFGSGCEKGPARLAALWRDDAELLAKLTQQWLAQCSAEDGALNAPKLLALGAPEARHVLRAWLGGYSAPNLARVHLENILAWLRVGTSGTALNLPGGVVLQLDFEKLTCRSLATSASVLRVAADYRIVVSKQGDSATGQGPGDLAHESTWTLECPAEALNGRLRVRNWQSGDRCRPLGRQGSKKLSDIFRENHLSREARPGVLVVSDDEGILWVVGVVRDERTRMLPSTAQTVTISVVRRTDDGTTMERDPTREDHR